MHLLRQARQLSRVAATARSLPARALSSSSSSKPPGTSDTSETSTKPTKPIVVGDMVETRRSTAAAAAAAASTTLQEAISNLARASNTCALPVSSKHAAVLVALFESPTDGELHVILTQRSSKMRKHAGEVCLPGGKREAGDTDDVATALREAHEELGIDPGAVTVLATMPPLLSKHLLSVTPVVATVPPGLSFTPSPTEVAHVFTAPLGMFLRGGPCYQYRDVAWEGLPYRLHYWDYKYRGQEFLIWGLTAGVLIMVAEQALGRRAAFPVHPPGALPYSALAYERGRLVFRGGGGAARGSAAVPGAMVTAAEAEAAVGGEQEEEEDGGVAAAGGEGGGSGG